MLLLHLVSVLTTLLCVGESYTIRSAVSWAVAGDAAEEEELDTHSDEAPAVLVDNIGIWKPAYPSSVYRDASEKKPEQISKSEDVSSASRVFSYRMEEVKVPSSVAAPPPHEETAKVARYMAHYSDWGHLATISTQEQIKGLPFGNVFSVSDGPADNSTGVPYFYVTPMDNTVMDLRSFPFASLTFSEAEGDFCRKQVYDPEDPRCARLTLTGKMVEVGPEELDFAKEAMFSRHPVMKKWPPGHNWFFMKLVLQQVWLQDWVGGVSVIPLEEYFKATPF
ncbi:protein CREG2-like isoform X1 [Sinocyclocheilus rhinocerous]|uniref:Protein CREG2-like n=1 Tax=Sinocyclocheilus rhinocerous TaxID=307959 RepID=A0A673K086_9TELE|nr:PREDICTED: protein CREG2-like isoform X1 [Sinocyclocheilus rhinocerous]